MTRTQVGLTREGIVEAALHIVDGQGLRRLTMRRLGDALTVEAMAIYHHFPRGKDQLLDAMIEHVAAPPQVPAEGPWEQRLRTWAQAYRVKLLEHAGALPLLFTRPVPEAVAFPSLEGRLTALTEAGLDDDAILDKAHALAAYVLGHVVLEVQAEAPGQPPTPPPDGRHPNLARLRPREVTRTWDRRFTAGLDVVLHTP